MAACCPCVLFAYTGSCLGAKAVLSNPGPTVDSHQADSAHTFARLALGEQVDVSGRPVGGHSELLPGLRLEAEVLLPGKGARLVAGIHHVPPVVRQRWHCVLHEHSRADAKPHEQAAIWGQKGAPCKVSQITP